VATGNVARVAARYTGLALATVAAAVAGYLGYVVYPRFELPAGVGAGLLVLAAGAGIASFFSPCSFPLLVSILARAPAGRGSAFRFAAALSLGATIFLVAVGAGIAAGGAALFGDVTFTSAAGRAIRIAVGVLLVALGLVQLGRIRVSLRRFEPAVHGYLRRQAEVRRKRPFLGFTLFGFGYLVAGFG
jgi:cytochrome c biogenesis protein CcdA